MYVCMYIYMYYVYIYIYIYTYYQQAQVGPRVTPGAGGGSHFSGPSHSCNIIVCLIVISIIVIIISSSSSNIMYMCRGGSHFPGAGWRDN